MPDAVDADGGDVTGRPSADDGAVPISRRSFVGASIAGAAAVGIAALGLSGCSDGDGGSDDGSTEGLATDTEQKDYPITLKIYADSYLRWHAAAYDGYDTLLDYLAASYQENVKSDVYFEFEYLDPADLLEMAQDGFEDGDALIAQAQTVAEGCAAGTCEGGSGNYLVRSLSYHLSEECIIVRPEGSDEMLPEADTLDGEDSSDNSMNRMQKLPEYDGIIAIADPGTATEGICADKALAMQGFYSDMDGVSGFYDESIASKLRMYPDQDSAMAAVENGVCQLGFALATGLAERYPEMEECYEPTGGDVYYSGVALSCADEPGVARDFFEYLANQFSG